MWMKSELGNSKQTQVTVWQVENIEDYRIPFWTCHSSGNLVDGLPLAIHKDAVIASFPFLGRAPIHKFRCKILDDANLHREEVLGNPEFSIRSHIRASEFSSEGHRRLDQRPVLSVSIFQKCLIFLLRIWNSRKIQEFIWRSIYGSHWASDLPHRGHAVTPECRHVLSTYFEFPKNCWIFFEKTL